MAGASRWTRNVLTSFPSRARRSASRKGKDCPAHLFLPALVPGEQIDSDPEAETVTYRLRDGTNWIDGGNEEAA